MKDLDVNQPIPPARRIHKVTITSTFKEDSHVNNSTHKEDSKVTISPTRRIHMLTIRTIRRMHKLTILEARRIVKNACPTRRIHKTYLPPGDS